MLDAPALHSHAVRYAERQAAASLALEQVDCDLLVVKAPGFVSPLLKV